MNVFSVSTTPKHSWISLSDVDKEKIHLWKQRFAGNRHFTQRMDIRQRQELLKKENLLISIVNEEVASLPSMFPSPCLFFLADSTGTLLNIYGAHVTVNRLESANVGIGTSMALEHAGINAISLAMQTDSIAIVQGSEHSLTFFSEWSCICSPILQTKGHYGYLDISIPITVDIRFMAPLLKKLAMNIETKLEIKNPAIKKSHIYKRFDQYGLTNREKEIAYNWLHDKNAFDISQTLFISEATVRHTLKKVYSKTNCHNKGTFIRKFFE